ncbi:MAG: alpha-ketoacid dehydrogenase subunit alpha/beta [Bacteroidota bacterium]
MQFKKAGVLADFKLAHLGRQVAFIGRREVLSGKAKFGIFGDGKEVAQIAYAKQFRNGDWRSGYYRDHTFMFAAGLSGPKEFFYQLYGVTDETINPGNAGRSFNNHFATLSVNPDGSWNSLTGMKNSAADLSPTAGQMPRLIGLGYASKLFRQNKALQKYPHLSDRGNEVAFGMIGDASTAEGHFYETMNAAAVLQIPVSVAVWDDGYGISVPKKFQTVKESISDALKGFESEDDRKGILIYKGKGWDYPGLVKMFEEGIARCRKEHVPVLFHIEEMVQPMGHSTSGSHERYKTAERLAWEEAFDPLVKMEEWILSEKIATKTELSRIKAEAEEEARKARDVAWKAYTRPLQAERDELIALIDGRSCSCQNEHIDKLGLISRDLKRIQYPIRKDILGSAKKIMRYLCNDCPVRKELQSEFSGWIEKYATENYERYSSKLWCETERSALKVKEVPAVFSDSSPMVNGREIIRDNFDVLFGRNPLLVTFGEDSGRIGDVNKGLEGLQDKYGDLRITDTGIRELTIIGQGIGLALRGLRPIAEIQYFDYLLYGLQPLSDDLATLHWRTKGAQSAPLIIRTRGHRLEGIWHSGSPLSMVINSIRGIYVAVPRNMTQAAGMYNTLLEADDPALVIEPLNGYRLKERRPDNLGAYRVPLGIPEILREGTDLTLVTYGSCVRIAETAIEQLEEFGISVELIDVQTLLPFDLNHTILESVKKTNRVIFFDEDVPGGATAFMLQHFLQEQGGYYFLDSEPLTLTAREHRPAYSTDGDYFSNPSAEDVFETVYRVMHESDPGRFPSLY